MNGGLYGWSWGSWRELGGEIREAIEASLSCLGPFRGLAFNRNENKPLVNLEVCM